MRIVDFEWHDLFTSLILSRGKKYFDEHRVGQMKRIGNTYIACVEGTEDYEVEITIEDGKAKDLTCTCPYAETDNCKHMAAMLFALETEDLPVEELPPVPKPVLVPHVPMESHWLEAIDKLPEEVVRKELMKRADRDDGLKDRLAVLYLKKLPEGQLQNWKADLQEMADNYLDRRGRINEEDAWEFTEDLGNFLNGKLPLLLEVNDIWDAFQLIWIVMETALEWQVDNSDDDVDELLEGCEEKLRKVYSLASDVQREEMMRWHQEHRNPEWPGGVVILDQIFQSLNLANVPVRGYRVVQFKNHIPCFLYEDEWISFPKRGHIYYDFVEETAVYKEVEPIVEALIKERLGDLYDHFGACHAIWYHRKRLLMEKYGIEWFSPAELNPEVLFD